MPVVGEWMDSQTQFRYLTLTYHQNNQATDLIFAPQAADDLQNTPWTTNVTEISRVPDSGWDIVTVRDNVPMSNISQRFMRLSVNRDVNE
jgi:hypothetical protein